MYAYVIQINLFHSLSISRYSPHAVRACLPQLKHTVSSDAGNSWNMLYQHREISALTPERKHPWLFRRVFESKLVQQNEDRIQWIGV